MLYYYAEKSRLCLVRHSTIIFYKPSFVKHHLKYLAILPRFASRSAAFLCILVLARLFAFYAIQIFRRKSALRGADFCTQRTQCLRPARIRRRRCRNFSFLIISNPSAERTPHLLTPHSSLLSPHYTSNPSAERTPQFLISHFSFLISQGLRRFFRISHCIFTFYVV